MPGVGPHDSVSAPIGNGLARSPAAANSVRNTALTKNTARATDHCHRHPRWIASPALQCCPTLSISVSLSRACARSWRGWADQKKGAVRLPLSDGAFSLQLFASARHNRSHMLPSRDMPSGGRFLANGMIRPTLCVSSRNSHPMPPKSSGAPTARISTARVMLATRRIGAAGSPPRGVELAVLRRLRYALTDPAAL
jgi:hypothetical protein